MSKIGGTIDGKIFFDDDYIEKLLTGIAEINTNVIFGQCNNLINILSSREKIFLSLKDSHELIKQLNEFLIMHYTFERANELIKIVEELNSKINAKYE